MGKSTIPDEKDSGLGDFAPKGSTPTMLGRGGDTDAETPSQGSVSDSDAMAALREFSPMKTGPSYSSMNKDEGIDVPLEDIATSLTNRKV